MSKANNYVPARRARKEPPMPVETSIVHTIDAPVSATQHVEVRTSATDRAVGFLISSVPLYAAFATAVTAVCVLGFNMPILTLPTITVFLLAFVGAWFFSYMYTLQVSAEGVSLFEAKARWQIIEEEQRRRWEAYDRQIEREERDEDEYHEVV